jgi:hypothetical protein
MSYLKKSYCFKNTPIGVIMRSFNGHIKKETAIKHNYSKVVLAIIDASGKGRNESRSFYAPYFPRMARFN